MDNNNNTNSNPPQPSQPSATNFDIKVVGNIPAQRGLVVAFGDAGAFWAKGADLGEQTAAVAINGVQVGLAFSPQWTQANVIISEATARLPVSAMHPYAQFVIDSLKPTSVGLLDEYSVPAPSASEPVPVADAPIRSISTRSVAPPNPVNTTSAAFLATLTVLQTLGTLVLLPSPNALIPAPPNIEQIPIPSDVEWPSATMNQAQQMVFNAISEPVDHPWQLTT